MAEQLNNQNTVHDATTGFNDIKAVPGFFPQSNWPYLLLFLFLAVSIFRIWKKFKRKEKVTLLDVPTPLQVLEIDLLKQESLIASENCSPRQFGTSLSLAIRKYFSDTLQISTEEQTVKEAVESLRQSIKQNCSWMNTDTQKEIVSEAKELLSSCEFLTFADNAELIGSNLISQAKNLITNARILANKIEQKPLAPTLITTTEVSSHAS